MICNAGVVILKVRWGQESCVGVRGVWRGRLGGPRGRRGAFCRSHGAIGLVWWVFWWVIRPDGNWWILYKGMPAPYWPIIWATYSQVTLHRIHCRQSTIMGLGFTNNIVGKNIKEGVLSYLLAGSFLVKELLCYKVANLCYIGQHSFG